MELNLETLQKELKTYSDDMIAQVKSLNASSSKEAQDQIAALKAEIAVANKAIEDLKQKAATPLPGLKETLQKQSFSWQSFIGALYKMTDKNAKGCESPWKGAEFEKEVIDQYAKVRANEAGDGSLGGYLVPAEVTNEVVELALAQMPIFELGATRIPGLVGELPLPRLTSRPTSYHVGENGKPTGSQATYGIVNFRPKKAAAFTKQSNRLIYQSRGVSDVIIKQALSESLALEMHRGLIDGKGSDHEPLGLLRHSGFTTSTVGTAGLLATNGAKFRIDHAAAMQADLDNADELAMPGMFGYLMSPYVKSGLKRERVVQYSGQAEAQGQPIMAINPLMSDKVIEDVIGYKVRTSSLVPKTNVVGSSVTCSDVIFGNFAKFYVGLWRDMVIKVSDQAGDGSTGSAFLDDQLYILALQEYDCHLVRTTAMTKVTGAETLQSAW